MDNSPFAFYDLIVLGVLGFCGLLAAFWGIVGLLGTVGAWIGAGLLALTLYPQTQKLSHQFISQGLVGDLVAAAGGFAIFLALLMLIGTLISRRVQASVLGPANRALGFAAGIGLSYGFLSIGLVVVMLSFGEDMFPKPWKESRSYSYLISSGFVLISQLPDEMKTNALLAIERERKTASDAYNAYQLYKRYVAPRPNNDQTEDSPSFYEDEDRNLLEQLINRANSGNNP